MINGRKTFTLVEMLVVVVIIGVLATALVPKITGIQAKARDTKRKVDIAQIGTALSQYKSDVGQYPTGATFAAHLDIAKYMTVIPSDNYFPPEYGFSLNIGTMGTGIAYGYLPMYARGIRYAGMVLISRMETKEMSNRMFVPGRSGVMGVENAFVRYGTNVTSQYPGYTSNTFNINSIEDLAANLCKSIIIYSSQSWDIPFWGTGTEAGLCAAPTKVINNVAMYYGDQSAYKAGMWRYLYVQ